MKTHVLRADTNGNYHVVIHTETPIGNNSAGKSWKDCWLEINKTKNVKQFATDVDIIPITSSLIEGTGPGNITTAELADVEAGNLLEIIGNIRVESGGATPTSVDEMVNQLIADFKARMQVELKYYGYTQDAV